MLLGIAVGYACHELWPDPQTAKTIAGYISLFTDIFLRLIKMIIAPLVFTTLVVGRRAYGRHQIGRPHRRQGDDLVCQRLAGLAAARPHHGQHPASGRQPQPAAARCQRFDQSQRCIAVIEGFRDPSRAKERGRGDGQQRDPANRRLFAVLWRRRGGAR
jgi:Na+/H+-dicarboxylate symporters